MPAKKTVSKIKKDLVTEELQPSPRKIFKSKKILIVPIVLAILIGLIGYRGLKWLVFAWVDGRPITKIELYKEMNKHYGESIREQLITEKLVISEAQKRGISVSNDEINGEAKKIQDQVGDQQKLQTLLSQQNMTMDDFKKQLFLRLLITKTFGKDLSVSDDEIKKYFDENKDRFAGKDGNAKLDDKTKSQITDQLKQQKISKTFLAFLDEVKKGNRVVRY